MKTPWTKEQAQGFIDWHESRMKELGYPDEIIEELRRARKKWMPPIK